MAGLQRPNYRLRLALRRAAITAVILAAVGTLVVTQRQRISSTWTTLQRHGVSGEWATVKHKAWEVWVAIRRDTPWPVVERKSAAEIGASTSRSSRHDSTATRGTHRNAQVAATSKRKGTRSRDDVNSPGSSP
jgi:hypothetical protein